MQVKKEEPFSDNLKKVVTDQYTDYFNVKNFTDLHGILDRTTGYACKTDKDPDTLVSRRSCK